MHKYSIIKKEMFGRIKCSFDIRLENKVSEAVLKKISLKLRKKKYDRVFICYYLPGMVVDAGAWATGHFNPDLKIIINDLQEAW
ncbi:MAG: hypothetical protein KAR42_15290 [candidate division Zixibacteria bacterium]|nr:hypothetical protein [candidate division Zixibacteria bacterium]